MTRASAIFPAILLATTVVLLCLGVFYYHYSWTALGFPLASGAALCTLCLIELVLFARGEAAPISDPTGEDIPPVSPKAIVWMFALGLFLYAFGFVAGPAIYLLVVLRVYRFSWMLSLVTSAMSVLVTWGLFIHVLDILLPISPLWMPE